MLKKNKSTSQQLLLIDTELLKGYSPKAVALRTGATPQKVATRIDKSIDQRRKIRSQMEAWYTETANESPIAAFFDIWMDFKDCKIVLKEWLFCSDERKQMFAAKYLNSYLNSERVASEMYFEQKNKEEELHRTKANAEEGLKFFRSFLDAE